MKAVYLIAMFALMPCANALVLNEIMYDPSSLQGDDSDFEWVELYNDADSSLDLAGWTLDCNGKVSPLSGILPPQEYLVVARELIDGSDADSDCFSCYYNAFAIDGLAWNLPNSAGYVSLCNPENVCQTVSYLDSMGADGDGSSLEFDGQEWLPSQDTDAVFKVGGPDGTPGESNSRAMSAKPEVPEFSTLTALFVLMSSLMVLKRRPG